MVDRWVGGSLTRRQQGSFSVYWPKQLSEKNKIAIVVFVSLYFLSSLGAYFFLKRFIGIMKKMISKYFDFGRLLKT